MDCSKSGVFLFRLSAISRVLLTSVRSTSSFSSVLKSLQPLALLPTRASYPPRLRISSHGINAKIAQPFLAVIALTALTFESKNTTWRESLRQPPASVDCERVAGDLSVIYITDWAGAALYT